MTGQDNYGRLGLMALPFFITKISKGCQGDEMEGTIRDRDTTITKAVCVGGGKDIDAIPEHNSCKWCLEHSVPGHHSTGTEITPNTEEQACKERGCR